MADNWTAEDERRYRAGVESADVPANVRSLMMDEESFPDSDPPTHGWPDATRDAMDTEDEAAAGRPQRDDALDQAVWAAILKHEANLPHGGRRGYAEGGEADIPPEDAPPPPAPPPIPEPTKPPLLQNGNLFDPVSHAFIGPAPRSKTPPLLQGGNLFDAETKAYLGPAPAKKEEPAVKDTGILGAIPAGLVGAGRNLKATGQLIAGQTPTVEQPDLLAAQPVEWKDFLSPGTLAKKTLYGFAESAPTIAAAMFGGAAGTALGGGPETPLGWATGIAGTATGAAVGSAIQSVGHNFGSALQETGGDADNAWDLAVKRTAIGAAGSGVGFAAFSAAPFQSVAKNIVFQAFGLQPAVAVGEKAAQNVAEGKPASEGALEGVPGAIIGTAAPLAAHQGARMLTGRGERPAPGGETTTGTTTPPPGGAPPPGLPPVGEAFGMDVGRGVEPVRVAAHTPEGDVVLEDAEGQKHPMAAADVARLRQELPNTQTQNTQLPNTQVEAEPGAAPPAAVEPPAPPAAAVEAPVPVPAAEPVPPAAAPVPRVTPPAAEPPARSPDVFGDEGSVMANLDRIGAEIEAGPEAERAKLEAIVKGVPPEAVAPVAPPVGAQAPAAPPVVRPEVAPEPPPVAAPAPPVREEPPAPAVAPEAEEAAPAPAEARPAKSPADMTPEEFSQWAAPAIEEARARAAGENPVPPEARIEPNKAELDAYADSIKGDLIRGVSLVGSAARDGRGRDVDVIYDLGERPLPADREEAAELVSRWLEEAGDSGLPLNFETYDSFFKVGDRFFHLSTYAGRGIVENTEYAQAQVGKPTIELGQARRAPEAAPPTERLIPEAPPPNTDESKPSGSNPIVSDEKHTKTGNDIYAVRFPVKPMIDDLGLNARKLGGYWSSFRGNGMQPGWMFKTREAADKFADWARGKIGENPGPRETEGERPAAAVENPVEAGENVTRVTPAAPLRPPIDFRPIRETTDPAFIPSTGASFPIQYAIVEARDLVTSHHDDLSPNLDYPQALQPRSRERAETEAQLSGILNGDPHDPNATFRPELLGENPDAANGSPIIGPEGYVESGNARTMAIRRAYDRDLPQAEAYRASLAAQGYPIEGIEQPVLVRINRAEMDMPAREQLARDLNVAPQATMSASDRAMADAQQIPGDLLRLYSGGDIFSAANRAFWKGILDRIAKPSELPTMTNPEGGLSPAGQTRVKNALLAKAYGDKDFVTALTEDADSNIKAIGNALSDAAPHWARLRDAVAEGRAPAQYDLTSPLIEAVRLIQHAREEGRNVVEYMNQRGLFGEGVSAETESLLRWMLGPPEWSRRHGREKIADTMVEYADSVLRPLRLGETRVAPPMLVENAREVAHGAAGDLFASPLGEPGSAAAVREGTGQSRPEAPGRKVDTAGADAPEGRPAEAAGAKRVAPTTPAAISWSRVQGSGQAEAVLGDLQLHVYYPPDNRGRYPWNVTRGTEDVVAHGRATGDAAARQAAERAARGQHPAGGLAEETRSEPAFFSSLTRAVEAIPQPKAPGAQWANLIRNLTNKGVKQDEIAWSGVLDWLKDNPGLVTKERLLDELRANEVRVEEVQHGAPTEPPEIAAKRERFQDLLDKEDAGATLSPEEKDELLRLNEDLLQHQNPYLQPRSQGRYGQYTLPGGENYRELLLTLPHEAAYPDRAELALKMFGKNYGELTGTQKAEVENAARTADRSQNYRTSHWEEPNVLAHIRMDDRTDAEGRRVLHVAEIQSDWHQAGRRRGYQGELKDLPEGFTVVNHGKRFSVQDPEGRSVGPPVATEQEARQNAIRLLQQDNAYSDRYDSAKVPNAPLKTQWPELAMKRVLRYAAENGYDRVTWDNGETQAARYDLSKHIQSLTYEPPMKGGTRTMYILSGRDPNGRHLDLGAHEPADLPNAVGKEVADRILKGDGATPGHVEQMREPPGWQAVGPRGEAWGIHPTREAAEQTLADHQTSRTLSGLDLKVGGEGMRGFYDKILPAFVNKYAKKWGAKVEAAEIDAGKDHFNYEGPVNFAGDDLARINREVDRAGVSLERQWKEVRNATVRGYTVAEAMHLHGSPALAEILGGKMVAKPNSAQVHAIDITQPMRDSVMRGQAIWERPGQGVLTPARNVTEDLQSWRASHPDTPAGSHEAAREFVTTYGRSTGNEYFGGVDSATGRIVDAGTSDHPSQIMFNDATMERLWASDGEAMDYHHNHPSSLSLSTPDLAMLAAPNLRWIIAHGHDGETLSAAQLTPEARSWLDGMTPKRQQESLLELSMIASDIVERGFGGPVLSKRVTPEQASAWVREASLAALDGAGALDYMSSRALPAWAYPYALRAARQLSQYLPWKSDPEVIFDRVHRSAGEIRPEAAMARLSGADEGATAAGRSAGEVRDQGSGARPEAEAQPTAGGLAEEIGGPERTGERDDPLGLDSGFDEPVRRVESVMGPPPKKPPPPSITKRFLNMFGAGPDSPGAKERWVNPVERLVIAPSNAARYDLGGVSRQKWDAERAVDLRKQTLRSNYVEELKPWLDLSQKDQQRVVAALELERLQGRATPLDGRAIILHNADAYSDTDPLAHQPLAQNSRPGESIRLDTPELIGAFTAYRKGMDKIYGDYIAGLAKSHGWDGDPTYSAIKAHADELRAAVGRDTADARHWDLIAKMVGLAEFARRTAYTPFMRQGDYFFRVVPKIGTEGWTGEGYPPTTWYSRIDSRLPEEKVLGGSRDTSETVEAYRAELQKTFPDSHYDLQEGYYHPTEDALRDIDIQSIEDLFQVVGRDLRREWRDKIRSAPDREAAEKEAAAATELHEKTVSALLDAYYERLKAGFKKRALNIPGYEKDLVQTTGVYVNWLSSHIADMEHRTALEAADKAVDQSYDKQTIRMWHDWDQARDQIHSPLDWGLSRLRSGAFYWALGANVASTIKVLLHGPMLGFPVLSTGFGGVGRAAVGREYLGAFGDVIKTIRASGQEGLTADLMKAARTPEERALVAANEANGRLHARGAEELGAIQRQGIEALSPQQRFNRRVLSIYSSNISTADRTIRGAMMLAAFRVANKPGAMDKINNTWARDAEWKGTADKTPQAFAEFITDRTAGVWGGQNKSEAARSLMGGLLFQFRSYELNFLSALHQQMWHMGPEGKVSAAMMLGSLGMMAGAVGLPFAQDIEKAYEWAHKMITGVDPNLNETLLQWAKTDPLGLGANAGKSFLYGAEPFGIDIGPGLSFGDPISREAQSPLNILGPAASIFIGGPMNAMKRSGQSTEAQIAELLPTPIKNLVKSFGVYPKEGVRTMGGDVVVPPAKLSNADLALQAAGLRPKTIGDPYRERERDFRLVQAQRDAATGLNHRLKTIEGSIIMAQQRGDTQEAARLQQSMTSAIANAPPGVRAGLQSIRNAARQAISPEAAAIRAAPKAARPAIAQPIFGQPQP